MSWFGLWIGCSPRWTRLFSFILSAAGGLALTEFTAGAADATSAFTSPAAAPSPQTQPGTPPSKLGFEPGLDLSQRRSSVWENDVGGGFRGGAEEAGFSLGGGIGWVTDTISHDMALGRLYYGCFLTGVVGHDHWYEGNLEILGEGFFGGQYSPKTAYLAGVDAVFRYNFTTHTRWVPFVDLGVGVLATDIKQPDLSSVFQFNEQGGPGIRYFWRDNAAITLQYRFMHISNAGFKQPNVGVNANLFYLGISWFF